MHMFLLYVHQVLYRLTGNPSKAFPHYCIRDTQYMGSNSILRERIMTISTLLGQFKLLSLADCQNTIKGLQHCTRDELSNASVTTGLTPMGVACSYRNANVLAALVKAGAICKKDEFGMFPLDWCHGSFRSVKPVSLDLQRAVSSSSSVLDVQVLAIINVLAQAGFVRAATVPEQFKLQPHLHAFLTKSVCTCERCDCNCKSTFFQQQLNAHNVAHAGSTAGTNALLQSLLE